MDDDQNNKVVYVPENKVLGREGKERLKTGQMNSGGLVEEQRFL